MRPVFEAGVLADLRPDAKNRAKELIEDFMIAANVATATFLGHNGFPSLRRVLQSPQRWERIVDLAAGLGHALPAAPDAAALDAFLDARRTSDPGAFPGPLARRRQAAGLGRVRASSCPGGRAEGHFGLAVRDYTHSTAPNRRFPDLVAQRLLKAALAGRAPPYSNDELRALAAHCTEQEDNATKVERQVRKSAAALLLAARIGAKFDAIVTGASSKGTWVRISHPTVEGRVVRGFEGLDVGDAVRVELVRTDARAASSTSRARDDEMTRRSRRRKHARVQGRCVPRQRRRAAAAHPRRVPAAAARVSSASDVRDTIVFFGSARLAPDGPLGRYYDEARELARLRDRVVDEPAVDPRSAIVVCTGGGGGIMEAANRGAADAGGRSDRPQHRPAARAAARTRTSRRS